jgi:hypothetical protein
MRDALLDPIRLAARPHRAHTSPQFDDLDGLDGPYDEAIRVPFRLMVPGAVEMRIPAIAGNVDVAPTLLALAGDTASRSFDGRSLLPLLAEPAAPWRKRLLLESYTPGYCGFRGTHWKYVRYASGEEELYRIGRDRFELRSLHLSKARVLKQMRARVFRSACRPPGLVNGDEQTVRSHSGSHGSRTRELRVPRSGSEVR